MAVTALRTPDPDPKPEEPTIQERQIGPVLAKKMLERNTRNRRLKPTKIAQYAEDMKAGRWLFNAEPIRFGTDGVLLDGQNRLHAIIAAGVTLPFLVVYGLDPTTQKVTDGGSARTAADNFQMDGKTNAAALAALCKQAVIYSRGQMDKNVPISVSSIEQAAFLEAHPELEEAVSVTNRIKSHVDARQAAIGFSYWLFAQKDYELATEFFTLLSTRANLPERSPILALDSRLRQLRKNQQKVTFKQEAALFIKSWNLWLDGGSVAVLMLPRPSDPLPKVKP